MSFGVGIVSREYPPFFGGGIGTYARHIVPALAAAGCRVHIITQAYDETHPRLSVEGRITVHRLPLAGGGAAWTTAIEGFGVRACRRAAELAGAGEIDIVEFAECDGAGAVYAALRHMALTGVPGLLPHVPAVVQLHTPTEVLHVLRSLPSKELSPRLAAYFLAERAAMRAADSLCAPSGFIADWAAEFYGLNRRPTVIPYAIDALPEVDDAAPVHKRILFVGRIEPRKGVEPLIRAWCRVAPQRPGWTLRLAGSDTSTSPSGTSMRGHLHMLMTPGQRESAQFLGPLPPEVLASEYAQASLCVVPSLWENYPNTCIEAMTHGRAVVASDEGGMREMLGDSGAGETFASGDVDDLARTLLEITGESPDRLRSRGRAGRERIARICDKRTIAAARIEYYRHVAAERRSTSGTPAAVHMLDLWRSLQRAASGSMAALDLPELKAQIARWIGTEAAA